VAALPTKRTLWTVIKGPFVHKKTQENFERRVHKRAIKVWDAHPDVVDLWASYLRKHAMGGVGMRVIKWTRAPVGVGEQMMNEAKKGWKLRKVANSADKVKKLGEQIVDMEMRKDLPAVEASLPKS
jgi:small subunit ribosomal protein S10